MFPYGAFCFFYLQTGNFHGTFRVLDMYILNRNQEYVPIFRNIFGLDWWNDLSRTIFYPPWSFPYISNTRPCSWAGSQSCSSMCRNNYESWDVKRIGPTLLSGHSSGNLDGMKIIISWRCKRARGHMHTVVFHRFDGRTCEIIVNLVKPYLRLLSVQLSPSRI